MMSREVKEVFDSLNDKDALRILRAVKQRRKYWESGQPAQFLPCEHIAVNYKRMEEKLERAIRG